MSPYKDNLNKCEGRLQTASLQYRAFADCYPVVESVAYCYCVVFPVSHKGVFGSLEKRGRLSFGHRFFTFFVFRIRNLENERPKRKHYFSMKFGKRKISGKLLFLGTKQTENTFLGRSLFFGIFSGKPDTP